MHLPADEGEAGAEGDDEFLDVIGETLLEIAFAGGSVEREKVEDVRVLQRLLGEVGSGEDDFAAGWGEIVEVKSPEIWAAGGGSFPAPGNFAAACCKIDGEPYSRAKRTM